MTDMVEITIKLPAEMVSRWRARGITDLETHLQTLASRAEVSSLPQVNLLSDWKEPTDEEVQETIAALREAAAEFREGLSEEELEEIVRDMNVEYIEPEDPELFAWLDELPEDER